MSRHTQGGNLVERSQGTLAGFNAHQATGNASAYAGTTHDRGAASAGAGPASRAVPQPCYVYTDTDRLRRYRRLQKMGEGSYGKVYKCEDLETGEIVAQKQVDWKDDADGVPSSSVREVSLLQDLQHPNVVRLLETVAEGQTRLHLFFEFFDKDLKRMLDDRATPLMGPKLKDIMFQLLSGLHACHSRRIVHRDLKLANVLVSKDETVVKLADFGLGKTFNLPLQTNTAEVMTLLYRAPEILLGERHYLPAVDMWSMGCIFAELARKSPLFTGECGWPMLVAMFQLLGTPSEADWPGVSLLPYYNSDFPQMPKTSLAATVPTLDEDGVDLLSRMLIFHPERRITAYQALQHRWFDEVRSDCEAKLQLLLARQEADQRYLSQQQLQQQQQQQQRR